MACDDGIDWSEVMGLSWIFEEDEPAPNETELAQHACRCEFFI